MKTGRWLTSSRGAVAGLGLKDLGLRSAAEIIVLVLPNFSVPRSALSVSCSSSGRFFSSSFKRAAIFPLAAAPDSGEPGAAASILSARRATACFTMAPTCATWSMPMKASTSGISLGNSSRKRCGRQPETITACPRWRASRSSTDSRIVSTLSSWAESIKEQVLTMTASALAASLVISTPPLRSEPSMISASTRFLAQPREIKPTRNGP